MKVDLDEKDKQELVDRIARIEKGERPEEMKLGEWGFPVGLSVLITLLLLWSL